MLKWIVIVAGVALAGSAAAQTLTPDMAPRPIPPAPTEPLFELFDRFCISTSGVTEAVLAFADAEGWGVAPPEAVAALDPDGHLDARQGPPLRPGEGPVMLVTGAESRAGIVVQICGVVPGSRTLNADALAALIDRRLAVSAQTPPGERPVWTYSGDGPYVDEGALFGSETLLDVARTRPIQVVTILDWDGGSAPSLMRLSR